MRRRRAVVTGGAGFLGSHLIERLLADDYEVLCLDNLLTGTTENLEPLAGHSGFRFQQVDVTEPLNVPGKIDAILHLASPASPIDYLRLPIETMRVGSVGTLNALELAKLKQARFLLASTSETYGDPQVHPQPESYWGHVNPVGPRAVYDEAKRFAEAATTAYRASQGVNTAIARIFNTYGPRMRLDDGRVIPTFVTQALIGEPLTVAGDGLQTRSVCYVSDMVEGLVRLLESKACGPMNLGNPEECTVLALAETIGRLTESAFSISFVALPVDDPRLRRPDISLARSTLAWEPEVVLDDGLLRTIAWCEEQLSSMSLLNDVDTQVMDEARAAAS